MFSYRHYLAILSEGADPLQLASGSGPSALSVSSFQGLPVPVAGAVLDDWKAHRTSPTALLTSRKVKKFCKGEFFSMLTTGEAKALQGYLAGLLAQGQLPPRRGRGVDITAAASAAGIDVDRLKAVRAELRPLLLALTDTVSRRMSSHEAMGAGDPSTRKRRGPKPKTIVEFPEPVETPRPSRMTSGRTSSPCATAW